MNKIRYRQFIKHSDGYDIHLWGFIDGVFVEPDKPTQRLNYPESFQSTGLHDSKGVEIWRESIMSGGENPGVIKQRASGEWIIVRHSGAEWELFGELEYYHRNKIEITVIGDTMQTPDLMEGELSDKAIKGINKAITELDDPDLKTYKSADECCDALDEDGEVKK